MSHNKTKKFRISAKNFLVTVPQTGEFSLTEKLDFMLTRFNKSDIDILIISKENHKDTEGVHSHIFIKYKKKQNIRDSCYFDFIFKKHSNISSVRSEKKCIQYVIKDGDYEVFGVTKEQIGEFLKSNRGRFDTVARKIINGMTMEQLLEHEPGFVLNHSRKIKDFMCIVQRANQQKKILSSWVSLSVLSQEPHVRQLCSWLNRNLNKQDRCFKAPQLYLYGSSNLGKTSLILDLQRFFRIYWMPTGENFHDLYDDASYDLIAFDEFKGQYPVTEMNRILQGSDTLLRVKGSQYLKKKNLPIIITSNYSPTSVYHNIREDDPGLQGFLNRIEIIEVTKYIKIKWSELEVISEASGEDTQPLSCLELFEEEESTTQTIPQYQESISDSFLHEKYGIPMCSHEEEEEEHKEEEPTTLPNGPVNKKRKK